MSKCMCNRTKEKDSQTKPATWPLGLQALMAN